MNDADNLRSCASLLMRARSEYLRLISTAELSLVRYPGPVTRESPLGVVTCRSISGVWRP